MQLNFPPITLETGQKTRTKQTKANSRELWALNTCHCSPHHCRAPPGPRPGSHSLVPDGNSQTAVVAGPPASLASSSPGRTLSCSDLRLAAWGKDETTMQGVRSKGRREMGRTGGGGVSPLPASPPRATLSHDFPRHPLREALPAGGAQQSSSRASCCWRGPCAGIREQDWVWGTQHSTWRSGQDHGEEREASCKM